MAGPTAHQLQVGSETASATIKVAFTGLTNVTVAMGLLAFDGSLKPFGRAVNALDQTCLTRCPELLFSSGSAGKTTRSIWKLHLSIDPRALRGVKVTLLLLQGNRALCLLRATRSFTMWLADL
jgi:hypothetical protein